MTDIKDVHDLTGQMVDRAHDRGDYPRRPSEVKEPRQMIEANQEPEMPTTVLIVYHLSDVRDIAADFARLPNINVVQVANPRNLDPDYLDCLAGDNAIYIFRAFGGRSISWTIVHAGCSIHDAMLHEGYVDYLDFDFIYADEVIVDKKSEANVAILDALHACGIDPFQNW